MSAITVIGAGYVGLVTSACFASLGHVVCCVETDGRRLELIKSGVLPIHEPGLDELVNENSGNGKLNFVNTIEESLNGSEFVFLAVPTPSMPDGSSDLSAVMSVAEQLKQHAADGTTVVIKSTVPVGTGDTVAAVLDAQLSVVNNPEFLREGVAVTDFLQPDRIVVGSDNAHSASAVASLYKSVDAEVIITDRRSAELSKYASNAYLAVRLSFANEIARISQATDADIDSVTRILASDHRIGPHYLKTGIGWGGSCLPKDVSSLEHSGTAAGVETHMLKAAKAANDEQIEYLLSTLEKQLGGFSGKVIAMLGTAFKAGTDDVRESPAIAAALKLARAGVEVRVHDPLALEKTVLVAPDLKPVDDIEVLTRGADAVILTTDWPQYGAINWNEISQSMRGRFVFDARNALDADVLQAAGLTYAAYGRRSKSGHVVTST